MNLRRTAMIAAAAALVLPLLRNYRSSADLSGQTALITGSSRGLGFILARKLAAEGCKVVICARNAVELEEARADLAARGATVLAVPCDVSDQNQVAHLIATASERFGPIDILINNAGIIGVSPLQNTTVKDFQTALGVMFWGMLYPTLAVLPQMQARRQGRIVNITSIGGKVSVPHLLPYGSAKFAAVGFSQGLRAEVAQQGIHVTTVVPGLMRTGSYVRALFAGQYQEEFTWFALGSTLPLITMDAERAADQIVAATKRGDAECTLSLPAQILARFHGLFPGITMLILSQVNRFLLPAPSQTRTEPLPGFRVQSSLSGLREQLLKNLTILGQHAARQFHEHKEP